jgi:transposase
LAAQQRTSALETELNALRAQLHEAANLIELQAADLTRYKAEQQRVRPNKPERVPTDQLQLAFEQLLRSYSDVPAAQQLAAASAANDDKPPAADRPSANRKPQIKGRHQHGRRQLDLTKLPVERIVLDPDRVVAADGEGFEFVDAEIAQRVAFRPATYIRLEVVRRKWVRQSLANAAAPCGGEGAKDNSPMLIASMPESLWPSYMADPSATAAVIISKYDDSLPLHRQERISARHGFRVPRSTQCGWLGQAYAVLYRIADAMFEEARRKAFCIATDATGVPVRARGDCEHWHIFVFIADKDHIVFRYSAEHTSEAVKGMLGDFKGHLLADAAPVYDVLHRGGAIEVCCWFHLRRHFWRGLETDPQRALEVLALIAKLFEIERDCRGMSPADHTATRAERSRPVLALIDEWVARNKDTVDPRGPLDQGIGYYENQRAALHRFLDDGRLRLDNSLSEQQLRNAVLGRHNWMFFANETGLKWYTTFRSLIASCALHGIPAHEYLEQVLRLAPHWKSGRMLELSPRYWRATVAALEERQRQILVPPWEGLWPVVKADVDDSAADVCAVPA